MPTVATPLIMTSPGYLFGAPLGTALPTNTVAGSKFTDAWAAAWVPLGATKEGSKFGYKSELEAVNVAEFFDPIRWETTSREGSFAFDLASYTLHNVKRALNGGMGAITPTSGTGATALGTFEPVDPGQEVRVMLGWESQDSTMRILMRQVINGAEVSSDFKKAPELAVLPCQFNFEVPAVGKPFTVFTAGDQRLGV